MKRKHSIWKMFGQLRAVEIDAILHEKLLKPIKQVPGFQYSSI